MLTAHLGRMVADGAPMSDAERLATHEQLASGDRWTTTGTEAGVVRTRRPPWIPDGLGGDLGDVPALGQHTQDVLDWLRSEDGR